MTSPSEQTLLITGANSFVGGHIISLALNKGYHVRGTVRSEASAAKAAALFPQFASTLSLSVIGDSGDEKSYAKAFAGTGKPITGVINVAAPFLLKVDNIAAELLDPAVNCALAIVQATKNYGTHVRRFINTSSFAAICDFSQGFRPGYTYTEEDWNPQGYQDALKADVPTAYCISKALAEKALWDFVAQKKPAFSLTALNPAWVFGPHVGPITNLRSLNESTEALHKMLDAKSVPGTDFAAFCDVRTVAAAHIASFETLEAANQRFLLGQHFDYQSAADAARQELPELKSRIPEGKVGAGKLEAVYAVNGNKAERVLGLKYIPLEQCMKDSFVQLLQAEKAAR